jgi:hypothetical protein
MTLLFQAYLYFVFLNAWGKEEVTSIVEFLATNLMPYQICAGQKQNYFLLQSKHLLNSFLSSKVQCEQKENPCEIEKEVFQYSQFK